MPPPVRLTVDGELAVRVENQLLNVPLFGLLQRSAGGLAHTHTHTQMLLKIMGMTTFSVVHQEKTPSKTEL